MHDVTSTRLRSEKGAIRCRECILSKEEQTQARQREDKDRERGDKEGERVKKGTQDSRYVICKQNVIVLHSTNVPRSLRWETLGFRVAC